MQALVAAGSRVDGAASLLRGLFDPWRSVVPSRSCTALSGSVRQRRHCATAAPCVAHDTWFTVCIGEVGVSPAAPKTLDAGSGRDECVAFAPTTHPDPLGIRNGRSEAPSLGGEDSRLSIINVSWQSFYGRTRRPETPIRHALTACGDAPRRGDPVHTCFTPRSLPPAKAPVGQPTAHDGRADITYEACAPILGYSGWF